MPIVSLFHIAFGFLALISGGIIFLSSKGTSFHKKLGYLYVASMFGLNITALFIYKVFNFFGPFHVLALLSLASVIVGFIPAIKRKEGWYKKHYEWMGWSFCGLCAAAIAELGTHPPFAYPSIARAFFAFVAPVIVFFIGRQILVKNRGKVLEQISKNL